MTPIGTDLQKTLRGLVHFCVCRGTYSLQLWPTTAHDFLLFYGALKRIPWHKYVRSMTFACKLLGNRGWWAPRANIWGLSPSDPTKLAPMIYWHMLKKCVQVSWVKFWCKFVRKFVQVGAAICSVEQIYTKKNLAQESISDVKVCCAINQSIEIL